MYLYVPNISRRWRGCASPVPLYSRWVRAENDDEHTINLMPLQERKSERRTLL